MSRIKKDFDNAPRNLEQVTIEADFTVVGGGLAGVCAAIAAAREGLKVVLIQDRPVLGGNASSEVRLWSLGATSHMANNNSWSREAGVIGEIMEENLFRNREGNPIIFDTVLLDFVRRESNIQLLLNTAAFDAEMKDNTITGIKAFNSINAKMYEITSNLFCDASGDGTIGYLAGADYRIGAEDQQEFGEKFAPDESYGDLLGHTIFFYTRDTGKPVDYVAPDFALKDITEIPRYKNIKASEYGCKFWWLEYGGRLDTIHNSEEIKWELWKIVYGIWDHIKNSGEFPEAETMTLEWVGHIPGKRESRRFEGDYMLTQKDIIEQIEHHDAVSFGGWSIDLHPADGVYSERGGCDQWHSKGVYQIPLRSMYSRNISNLFTSGRLISSSHVAFGSTRVMQTCAINGEAVGTAAALCIANDLMPRELAEKEAVKELQQRLLKNGQYIPGVSHDSKQDLAKQAQIEASSTYELKSLSANGEWQPLNDQRAMALPVSKGQIPAFSLKLNATKATTLDITLRKSQKTTNYTPEIVLESQTIQLNEGEQTSIVEFSSSWNDTSHAFICLSSNSDVEVALSDERLTGVISLIHENVASSFTNRQEPAEDIGVDTFDFWVPERRPAGKNFAIEFARALPVFSAGNVLNGVYRPANSTNAWAPAQTDEAPALSLNWDSSVEISQINLHMDNDFDHAMETVQWGHPESVTPFCIRSFRITDDQGNELCHVAENHLSHRRITLETPVNTGSLKVEILKSGDAPAAIFGISCF